MQRIRRRAPLALALAAPLLLSPASSDRAAGGDGASPEALTCEVPATAVFDRGVEGEIARLAAEGALLADSDVVVLNNRGYNYGPAEPDQLDRIRLEALMTRVESLRR